MANQRSTQIGQAGCATHGSVHEPPFPSVSFHATVAIGCAQHTGDLQRSIDECSRLIKNSGISHFILIYNAPSFRRFVKVPLKARWYRLREYVGFRGAKSISRKDHRASFDSNVSGDTSPHSDWISWCSIRYLCHYFYAFVVRRENFTNEYLFSRTLREKLLLTTWSQLFELNIYAHAIK